MKKYFIFTAVIFLSLFSNGESLNNTQTQANSQIQGGANDSVLSNVVPLKLAAISPQANATNICIDTPLRLIFNTPPVLSKSGTIQILDNTGAIIDSIDASARILTKTIGGLPNFNYYPIIINGNEAVIAFKNNILSYGKSYEVKISEGLFVDHKGNAANLEAAKTWRFTTKSSAPSLPVLGPRRITVAADSSGDFATVQGALDFIPAGNTAPVTIFIRKGVYNEIIYLSDLGYPSARNLSFSNIRLHNATEIIKATQIAPEKPVQGLSLENITGTAAKGMNLCHIRDLTLKEIKVTGFSGSLLTKEDVTGTGLDF